MDEMIRIQQSALLTALLILLVCWMPATVCAVAGGNISLEELSSQPVQFITNVGQSPDIIEYQAKSQDFSFDFTKDGIVISGTGGPGSNQSEITPLIVTLEGARNDIIIEPLNQLPGYANFLKGQNESDYKQYVPWYGEIRYADILPGINLSYSGKSGILKREYQVSPGSDPDQIKLTYSGAEEISLKDDGSLLVRTQFGNLTEAAPVSYQDIKGTHTNVSSQYEILNGSVGFKLGSYDPSYPLIIDPNLQYSTYLSGSYEDYGMDIAMDSSGNAYVVGYTCSCDFPLYNPINVTSPITYNGTYCHDGNDVFVTKLNETSGNATIAFSTYLGGNSLEYGRGIAIDSSNNIYVTGDTTSTDFPVLYPIQSALKGSNDAFITKIRSDGANFAYSTYLGGTHSDQANDIALDSSNAAYITGFTKGNSPLSSDGNFPVTSGAYQTTPTNLATEDAFVSKISAAGSTLLYSSYIGGSSNDEGNGIAIDTSGLVYLVGITNSNDLLPSGVTGLQKTLNGTQDAYVFKMNISASSPVTYATYLGGSTVYDYGQAIAADSSGCAYVTGSTASTNFPVTSNAKQKTKADVNDYFDKDAFVTKYSADGTAYVYSTYLGGSEEDYGYDIKVDGSNRAFVTGYTKSGSFPKVDSIKSSTTNGNQDGFLTCVNADGSDWVYSTTFGGYDVEVSHGVAVSSNGNVSVVTGWTASPSIYDLVSGSCSDECFPVTHFINQTIYQDRYYFGGNFSGGEVAIYHPFVMKFNNTPINVSISANNSGCGSAPFSVTFYDNSGDNSNILERVMSYGDGSSDTSSDGSIAQSFTHTYTTSGEYDATLTLYTASSSVISNSISINVCNPYISANFTVNGNRSSPIDVPYKTSLTFTGEATNYTPSSWTWNFGDGTANATGQNVVHQFSKTGTYTTTLSPKAGTCCNDTFVQKVLRVIAPPVANFINTTPRVICAGDSVVFNDTSLNSSTIGAPTSWEWNFGDNTSTETTQNVSHTFSFDGTYTVSLTVSNAAGTDTETKTDYVSVFDNLTAGFHASPVTGTSPLSVQFTDETYGIPTGWSWTFGDGGTSTLQNPEHTYTQAGVYSVSLNATSACGPNVEFTWPDLITVNGNMTPTMLFGPSTSDLRGVKYNGTVPLTVALQGDTQGGSLIDKAWFDFGDGNVSNNLTRNSSWPGDNSWVNVTHLYSVIGDYTPVIHAYNNTWAENTSSGYQYNQSIGVAAPMVPSFTMNPASGAVTSQEITFTDTSSGNPTEWHWLYGDGNEASGCSTVTHAYTSAGSYSALLEIWNKYGLYGGSTNQTISVSQASTSSELIYSVSPVNMTSGDDNWRKIQLLLDRADYGLTSYRIKIELNDTSSVYFSPSAERPWWVDSGMFWVNSTPNDYPQSITLFGMDVTGRIGSGSTNVSLGNVTLYTRAGGDAHISLNASVSVAQFDSSYISLSSTNNSVHVDVIGPLQGSANSPNDLKPDYWHDGLLDDFDGNGVVNLQDVYIFMQAYAADELASLPVAPFDYNPDGIINTYDIVVFFNRYLTW